MRESLTDHAARNRESWAKEAASWYVAGAERNWAVEEITWGILDVPESEVRVLPDVAGKRFDWVEDTLVDFHLGYGDWIRVLTSHGFEVEALVELRGRGRGRDAGRYNLFTAEWAERWPAEEMWKARKKT